MRVIVVRAEEGRRAIGRQHYGALLGPPLTGVPRPQRSAAAVPVSIAVPAGADEALALAHRIDDRAAA